MGGDRQVIVVLGMDRTGTSLCTQILNVLGMELDEELLPPNPANERGYFESVAVFKKNERLLAMLGSSWDEVHTLKPLSPRWWRLPEFRDVEEEMVALLRQRLQAFSGIWGFKDPRTAYLLPLWRRVFRSCGVQPIYVLAVRHPAAVATSLATRHLIPRQATELLWLERYYNACALVGPEIRCVVHYEDWFSTPMEQAHRVLAGTGLRWPSTELDLEEALRSVVVTSLRHYEGQAGEIQTGAVRCLYDYFRSHCQPPSQDFLEKFDFAMSLSRDYAAVASELLGRPLVSDAKARWRFETPREQVAPEPTLEQPAPQAAVGPPVPEAFVENPAAPVAAEHPAPDVETHPDLEPEAAADEVISDSRLEQPAPEVAVELETEAPSVNGEASAAPEMPARETHEPEPERAAFAQS
ncbi:MAG: sulfotransferase [Bryobacteraceae bacterium]|jgi:hypothetical protein